MHSALGVITRNGAGDTVNFIPSATSGAGSITTSTANNAASGNAIIGGWATDGGTAWAVSGSGTTAGAISALTSFSAPLGAGGDTTTTHNDNFTATMRHDAPRRRNHQLARLQFDLHVGQRRLRHYV